MKVQLKVSGPIPRGETTRSITYFVVDRSTGAIAGNLTLPDAATFANAFAMTVDVPRVASTYDVGTFNEAGEFVSANFDLTMPEAPKGAYGAD